MNDVAGNSGNVSPEASFAQLRTRIEGPDEGLEGIRVHPISPGPIATRAPSGIAHFDELMQAAADRAPVRMLSSIEDVGVATAFLAADDAKLITGDVMYVDGGYHIVG